MEKIVQNCTFALVAGSVALASIAASAQPAPAPVCLRQDMVNGWKVVNDQTLIVTDRVGHEFTVSLAPGCHDLKWPSALGFSSGTGTPLGCIERNALLNVPGDQVNLAQRCVVENVQPSR